jgi:hypothetical protein
VDAGTSEEPVPPAPPPPKADGCSTTGGLVPAAWLLALTPLRRFRRRSLETQRT